MAAMSDVGEFLVCSFTSATALAPAFKRLSTMICHTRPPEMSICHARHTESCRSRASQVTAEWRGIQGLVDE